MKTPDWGYAGLVHDMRVELVDPFNLETYRGELQGVQTSGRLSLNYYGDTRSGLTISTSVMDGDHDGWDGTAAMRLIHSVGDWEEELFTGYVTDREWSDENGIRTTSYTLSSCLYGLSVDYVGYPWTVGENAMGLDVIAYIFKKCRNRPNSIKADALNYRFGSATVYEANKTWLSVLFDVSDRSGDRVDVDAHGYVTVDKYVSPSERTPFAEFDTADKRSVTVGPLTWSDNRSEIPSRVIVHAKDGDTELTGWAYQPDTSQFTHPSRGYNLDSYHEQSDMEPFTQAQIDALAARYLNEESALVTNLDIEMMYLPVNTGWVIGITHEGEYGRYMISTAELDLNSWVWSLGLKGVG